MAIQSAAYVFDDNSHEIERLETQARAIAPEATWLLDSIGVQPGWKAADIGCGPIGILDLLAQRVGASGTVVGIERDKRFLDIGRSVIARRGLRNVRMVLGDALTVELEPASFDLVHERLLLINVPVANQKAIIDQMLALLKPGGTIALQDYDRISYACYPEHPSWTALSNAYSEAFEANGGTISTGRSLPRLLRDAGVQNISAKVHAAITERGDTRRMDALAMLEALHTKILTLGYFSAREFAAHKQALVEHLSDPDTLIVERLLVQAWGTKP
jgi:ubiquinone/menaquinone biosynthesis C-methylase UbiE